LRLLGGGAEVAEIHDLWPQIAVPFHIVFDFLSA
jgi:hypothetical protein